MNDLIIYGCGSVGRMVEQIVFDINNTGMQWKVLGFIDDDEAKHGTIVAGYPVFGGIDQLAKNRDVFIALGLANPRQKQSAIKKLSEAGVACIAMLVHPRAWISRRVEIGKGSIIYPGVHIDVDVKIGQYVLLNKLCTVGHDTVIGDYATAAPSVNLGGNCVFGDGVELGINSSSIQGLSVGAGAKVGAGAVVVKNVEPNTTVVGVPAKPLAPRQ